MPTSAGPASPETPTAVASLPPNRAIAATASAMRTAGTIRARGTQMPRAGSRPSRALAQEAPPPRVAAAEMSAASQSQMTVVTTLPETVGTDSVAKAAAIPTRSPAPAASPAARRGSPPSAGWLAPAGRITNGRMTAAPPAAAPPSAAWRPGARARPGRRAGAFIVMNRPGRARRAAAPSGQLGQDLRGEQHDMVKIVQVEPEVDHLGTDGRELADPVDHLSRRTAQRVLGRQRALLGPYPGPVRDLGR